MNVTNNNNYNNKDDDNGDNDDDDDDDDDDDNNSISIGDHLGPSLHCTPPSTCLYLIPI